MSILFFIGHNSIKPSTFFSYVCRLCKIGEGNIALEALTGLLSQYSIETLILLIVSLGLAIKFVSELWEYFYNKIKKYFNYQTQKDRQHEEIIEGIGAIKEEIIALKKENIELTSKVNSFDDKMNIVNERLQESTRSFIIDKHHYFCYTVGAIDDLNLQSLERHFLYYKASGGNSFIDGLMEDIRALPRLNISNQQLVQR